MIYFDNAATTIPEKQAADAMFPYLWENYGNPGSVHALGRRAKDAVDRARRQVSHFLDCGPNNVIFTSSGSEANTMVFRGLESHLLKTERTHVIITKGEHESVQRAADWLERRGFSVTRLDIGRDGTVTAKQVEQAIRPNTGLVSVMYCPNELDGVNPVYEIGEICYRHGVLFHTDAVQAAGIYWLTPSEIGCDFMSVSSHKIHGPKGCGALYAETTELLEPTVFGGGSQEHGLRGGTENVAAIVGFGRACEIYDHDCDCDSMRGYYRFLKEYLDSSLTRRLFERGLTDVYSLTSPIGDANKLMSVRFDGVDAETLVLALSEAGVCISSGSACNSHSSEPSGVLLAAGLTPVQARNTVRISFSRYNTVQDVEEAAETIAACVAAILEG